MSINSIFGEENQKIYEIQTHAAGPEGSLPLTPEILRERPSGDIFGMTLDAGMGWEPSQLLGKQVLILGTLAGMRDEDGTPIALGYHTGNYELGLQIKAAAEEVAQLGGVPYASY